MGQGLLCDVNGPTDSDKFLCVMPNYAKLCSDRLIIAQQT